MHSQNGKDSRRQKTFKVSTKSRTSGKYLIIFLHRSKTNSTATRKDANGSPYSLHEMTFTGGLCNRNSNTNKIPLSRNRIVSLVVNTISLESWSDSVRFPRVLIWKKAHNTREWLLNRSVRVYKHFEAEVNHLLNKGAKIVELWNNQKKHVKTNLRQRTESQGLRTDCFEQTKLPAIVRLTRGLSCTSRLNDWYTVNLMICRLQIEATSKVILHHLVQCKLLWIPQQSCPEQPF